MLARDRVLCALSHKRPDHVPLDFWAVPEVWEQLFSHFGTRSEELVLRHLQVDIRQFQPAYTGPALRQMEDGTFYDAMGCHRKYVQNKLCVYEEYASYPLAAADTLDALRAYPHWPNPDDYDYEGLRRQIGDLHETHYIKLETGGLFEFAWALRGLEAFFTDMLDQPEIPHFIMGKLTDFYCEYVRRTMEAAGDLYDLVYTYDDIAGQNCLLLSPAMWEEFLKPYHQRLNAVIHSYGKSIMYHSCGAVFPMIDRLAQLPIDILNPLQPDAAGMDFARIHAQFGHRLCFHGGIDIQHLLPHGTPEQVRAAVRAAIDTLGADGGYILSSAHYMQADTPVCNILAMYDEAVHYRREEAFSS